jgi:protein-L-isoaspartate(D-aspartate) O-methyltransferase
MQDYHEARQLMVQSQIAARGVLDERVLGAMREIRRHEFVEPPLVPYAYDDNPLSIGLGQTISQPYIVARMTELLDVQPNHRVLEIGGGCGYQSAILCKLCAHVYCVERHSALVEGARRNLARAGLSNFTLVVGDGMLGLARFAPYDRVLAGCAPEEIPRALIDQLALRGKLVLPVGPRHGQELTLVQKDEQGRVRVTRHGLVSFVPMVAGA